MVVFGMFVVVVLGVFVVVVPGMFVVAPAPAPFGSSMSGPAAASLTSTANVAAGPTTMRAEYWSRSPLV